MKIGLINNLRIYVIIFCFIKMEQMYRHLLYSTNSSKILDTMSIAGRQHDSYADNVTSHTHSSTADISLLRYDI